MARERYGLTQDDLCKKMKIGRTTLWRLERRKDAIDEATIHQLDLAFGASSWREDALRALSNDGNLSALVSQVQDLQKRVHLLERFMRGEQRLTRATKN